MTPLEAITAALRGHYLSPDRSAADADGNAPCVCGGWYEPGPMGDDEDDWDNHMAEVALAAIQGLYVPPPPGSDRDALPEDLRALITPHMRPYLSTYCETARACHLSVEVFPDRAADLQQWEQRQHAACRITRKQDMTLCGCDCHTASKT